MTRTTNTVGSSPDGVSDLLSTATVIATLPAGSYDVVRCCACPAAATVTVSPHVSYCDIHAGDALRLKLKQIQLNELTDYNDAVIELADVVGQGKFVKYDLRYARRDRLPMKHLRTKPFRFGLLRCDRCDASWIGVEHEVCSWCISKAYRFSDGNQ